MYYYIIIIAGLDDVNYGLNILKCERELIVLKSLIVDL